MDYKGIGQRIRRYRKLRDLTQEQLAEMVDISVPHMSHIETACTQLSLPVITSIARELGVAVDALLYEMPLTDKDSMIYQIAAILEGCTPEQAQIIMDIMKATRQTLDQHPNH